MLNTTLSYNAGRIFHDATTHIVAHETKVDMNVPESDFVHHMYVAFLLKDEDVAVELDSLMDNYFKPAVATLVQGLENIKRCEYMKLPCKSNCGVRQRLITNGVWQIPLRFTYSYDPVNQGTKVVLDYVVRHIGKAYKTIINGPLHRQQMPFEVAPVDGHRFEYLYVPRKSLNYTNLVWNTDDYEDLDYTEVLLPGLEEGAQWVNTRHMYRVNGDYCYYMGETMAGEVLKL